MTFEPSAQADALRRQCFGGIYRGRRVLITGHTGFKGSWLALWLQELGAEVYGYALPAPTEPSHWELLALSMRSELGDIRDADHLRRFVAETRPELVFHLAAQPLVRRSYQEPLETYATNVLGSLHVYEACRAAGSVRALVSITTDKVYENREWPWGYRESDPLGGHDPYSASKACADLASASYRSSFWPPAEYGRGHHTLLCTARAGNVIGGGDWAVDRLIPDLARGAAAGVETTLRNPGATRPWQHVLDPLSGYLLLGQRLWEGVREHARAWNFGPAADEMLSVEQVAHGLSQTWPALRYRVERSAQDPHEAGLLMLDCSLARSVLRWRPVWAAMPALLQTAHWYRAYLEQRELLSRQQLGEYVAQRAQPGLDLDGRCWLSADRSVLITGAAGFVGRSIAQTLAARGFRVTGLDRTSAPIEREPSPFTDFLHCDLLDEAALAQTRGASWFDAVVHLAGALPGHAARGELFAVNVGGTSAVLDRFARAGCHLILLSSGLVYGRQQGPFREDMDCLPAEPYGQSKLAAEELVNRWARATRSPAAVLRASVLYGRGAPPNMLLLSLMDALRRQRPFPMTPGEQLRDFLHVDDAAAAVATVLERLAEGTWNLASGESISVKQAAELGAAIAGRPELLRVGELPYRPNEVFDYRLDASALQRSIGFRPRIELAAGLTRLWSETA